MNIVELYRFYRAARTHFTNEKYDFFVHQGKIKGNFSLQTIEKLNFREKNSLQTINKLKEPKTYIIGNLIFNSSSFIGDFEEKYYLQYRKYITNGHYIFSDDLSHLKSPLPQNFKVDSENQIPYIIRLYISNKISLLTCCVFNKLINWTDRFTNDLIIQSHINKIRNATGFFKIDPEQYKTLIVKHKR